MSGRSSDISVVILRFFLLAISATSIDISFSTDFVGRTDNESFIFPASTLAISRI